MKKDQPEPPLKIDRFAGSTDDQRREAMEVTANSDFSARYVGPGVFEFAERGSGAAWRAQIGKYFTGAGTVTHRNPDGKIETERWHDGSMFHLLGWGSTFLEAAEMCRKNGHKI